MRWSVIFESIKGDSIVLFTSDRMTEILDFFESQLQMYEAIDFGVMSVSSKKQNIFKDTSHTQLLGTLEIVDNES